jgi:ubiquinone/menaquinone biosynthesis C-methylase UbiE
VTSLSALDETLYPERALDQVYRSLRKGGFFVVLSDVNPGSMQLMQAIKKLGIEGPYSLTGTLSSIGMPNFHYLEAEGGLISVLEIYRRMLLQLALKHGRLEVVLSDWVTCKKTVAKGELCKIYQANNVFGVIRVPKPRVPFEEVSVAVTVLRKK